MKPVRIRSSVFLALLFTSLVASAEPDAATKEKARALGNKGLSFYDNGEFKPAMEHLEQAFRLYPAPTLGLYSARALAKMGRLTSASARYLAVIKMPLAADASEPFKQAVADATAERAALVERIPRLRVEIVAASGEVVVRIDGAPVAVKDLGEGVWLNPGAHEIHGQHPGKEVKMQVALQEGETKTVTLDLASASAPAPAAPQPTAPPAQASPPAAAPPRAGSPPGPPVGSSQGDRGSEADGGRGSGARTAAWVLIAVGGVGLGVGTGAAIFASIKKGDLDKNCKPDLDHCPEASRGVVDEYNTARTASTVGFIAGGVGVAAGAVLLATSPKPKRDKAHVTPWIGLGSAGMLGTF